MLNRSSTSYTGQLRRLLCVGFPLFLLLPTFAMLNRHSHICTLGGAEVAEQMNAFTPTNWFDGTFESSVDRWTAQRIGLRRYAVRLVNQAYFSTTGKIGTRSDSPVVLGKENQLFERGYLNAYVNPIGAIDVETARAKAKQVRELQQALRGRGIPFVLTFSCSKAELYPEFIPDDYVRQRQAWKGERFYAQFIRECRLAGVNVIDGPTILRDRKQRGEQMFSRTGTHWNSLGASIVWQEVLKNVNLQGLNQIEVPIFNDVEYDTPRSADNDLGTLSNLIFVPGGLPQVAYPLMSNRGNNSASKGQAFFAGTSFTHTLIGSALYANSVERCAQVYYNENYYVAEELESPARSGDGGKRVLQCSVKAPEFDLRSTLLQSNLVVLDFLETQGLDFDLGFCEDALAALKADEPNKYPVNTMERVADRNEASVR